MALSVSKVFFNEGFTSPSGKTVSLTSINGSFNLPARFLAKLSPTTNDFIKLDFLNLKVIMKVIISEKI